jgi:hypothetical protein
MIEVWTLTWTNPESPNLISSAVLEILPRRLNENKYEHSTFWFNSEET